MMRSLSYALTLAVMCGAVSLLSCGQAPSDEDIAHMQSHRVQFFTNAPGTRITNERNRKPEEFAVEALDRTQHTLDICVYGFSNQGIIDAVVRAYYRGVKVRVVGDARHMAFGDRGYRAMLEHRIPMQVGNQFHIMHNKFFVSDDRLTFVGTGNITTTGFAKNNNNWIYIDSREVALDFKAEFNQMFEGRFSNTKIPNNNGNSYQVGDTQIDVLFSPHEDTMGRMLAELRAAHTSVHFQIFAFTKDQVGSLFIEKHREFLEHSRQVGEVELAAIDRQKKVIGIFDKSQLHGNSQYHEAYRLLANGIPARIDNNGNSFQPGDYQAGGGRLHTKTMILDYGTPDARIVTGSFNWSSAATIANDEVLLVLRGERIVNAFMEVWQDLYKESIGLPRGMCNTNSKKDENMCVDGLGRPGNGRVNPGDVIFSEIYWAGFNGEKDPTDRTGVQDFLSNDEFFELYNTTDNPIDLSLWTIFNGNDAMMGFTPGTVIPPKSYFLVVDHNTRPFAEGTEPRADELVAFQDPDFVLNQANDPRFPRMNLRDSSLYLELRAPQDTTLAGADQPREALIVDRAGNRGPAFYGGRTGELRATSMERIIVAGVSGGDGTDRTSWKECTAIEGGAKVAPGFRNRVIATPGEPNSP